MIPARPATYREVFAVAEFRPLFGTFLLSTAGDELARVALTVLVFQRTNSPLLSALTFAISHFPWLIGGPLLSTLADRLPRHRVLITTDVVRALLLALMAVPGMPLLVLLGLLLLVSLCAPPFESARSALMADVLDGERYAVATSLTTVTLQVAQVVGFLVGGALVAVHPSLALGIDAVTFAVSALWLSARLQRRPAPAPPEAGRSLWRDAAAGLRFIGRTRRMVAIIAVLWVAALFGNAWEGIAAPLASQLGGGSMAIGVLLAANPAGVVIGGLLLGRLVTPGRRERLVVPLVLLSLAPLLAGGIVVALAGASWPSFTTLLALLFVSGLGSAWLIPLNIAFVQATPAAYRGRAFGVAVSGLYGVQGIGALAAGLAAEGVAPSGVLALCGGIGMIAVAPALIAYRRTHDRSSVPIDVEGAPRE
ncbi:Predicted arabinose efflux permease, MFS family [Blastococcus aggregatus]|uniref:Predicted arabinose efflux permease, MFS family n=1 Tax=Blastococcus aggregatus TaxID=38502 RepID=A0A285V130_9ACTN|nr:MFS transporter [Blastococcus aggregatus]SOC46241.1 Predicted arabinose efflux permease, MFS family [Blastococcus aggregatus]